MNSVIDFKRVHPSYNTVLVAFSRNFLDTVVFTFAPLPLQFPTNSQITLLLLLLLLVRGIFENYSWSWPLCGKSLI